MSERDVILRTGPMPHTVDSLTRDLRVLGVTAGMSVLVHSSLSAVGWVCGGAVGLVLALEAVLGPEGTLVMTAHSGDLSDPSPWERPPVPEAWWETIRATMPAYDPSLTPTRGVGVVPEVFRTQRGVARSSHPNYSFAAWGSGRDEVLADDKLEFSMDPHSPLGRLYARDGSVLLIGVGHDSNTSLHLAEYLSGAAPVVDCFAPICRDGVRVWASYSDIDFDCDDFAAIGAAFEETGRVVTGRVGGSVAKLMRQRELVDYATGWMRRSRKRGD